MSNKLLTYKLFTHFLEVIISLLVNEEENPDNIFKKIVTRVL